MAFRNYEDKVLAQLDMWRGMKKVKVVHKKRRQYPEFDIQCAINAHCEATFIKNRSLWHATENSNGTGGKGASRRQFKLRLMGSKKGFPDGIIFYEGAKSVLVEVKAPKGVVSDDQKAMHDELRAMGHSVEVVYSIDEFKDVVRRYDVPNRESVFR